jgi:hypothetical protein
VELVIGMVVGAMVALTAVWLNSRSTQAQSASLQQYSKDVLALSIHQIASDEVQISRDRSLSEMAKQVGELATTTDKLNLSVGNLVLMQRAASRTVLERAMQVGEVPPGAPSIQRKRTEPAEEPEEGLQEPRSSGRPGPPPAAIENRRSALAVPT